MCVGGVQMTRGTIAGVQIPRDVIPSSNAAQEDGLLQVRFQRQAWEGRQLGTHRLQHAVLRYKIRAYIDRYIYSSPSS